MKKNSLLFLPLIASALILVGCSGGGDNASFHIATFHLNYDTSSEIYQSIVVNKEANLLSPSDPNREEYLFKSWTTDKEGKEEFVSFDKPLSKNIDLYASWTPISEVGEAKKVSMLVDSLSGAAKGANHVYIKQTQVEYYPQFTDSPLSYYQEKDATRYKDITVANYYESDTDTVAIAEQQYFYDSNFFYSLLKDNEDSSNNNKVTAKFAESDIDSFLNVDFFNLYGADLKASLKLLNDPKKVRVAYGDDDSSSSSETEFVGDYSFEMDFDPTKFSLAKESYSFAVAYEIYTYNNSYGWVTNSYSTTATISFLNGKINRAIVQMAYYLALAEGPYYYSISSETCSFDYGEYADFTGTKWNPDDFKAKSSSTY